MKDAEYPFHTSRLANGLRVITAPMPHMAGVSVGVWVGIGSRVEPAQLNGACHFIEHMVFKGTRKRSASEIAQAVEGLGGYLNAYTSEEITCFHARAGAEHFEDLLDVLMDMYLDAKFDPRELSREREVIKEEIAQYYDEPQHYVHELLNEMMWPGQPLGRPITGTAQTLDGLGRGELTRFFRGHYVSRATVIVAAGRITHEEVLRAVERYEARTRAGAWPKFPPARRRQSRPMVRLFTKPTEQTQVALGIRACSRRDVRRYALRLLNTILGENMSSRLFQVVREQHGLAYSIGSTPSFFSDAGDLVISAGLDTDDLPKLLRLVVRELKRCVSSKPSRAELARAKEYVIGQMLLSLESTEARMNWAGEQALGYGRAVEPDHLARCLNLVTREEVQQVARDFIRPEAFNLALVSPLKRDFGMARLLDW